MIYHWLHWKGHIIKQYQPWTGFASCISSPNQLPLNNAEINTERESMVRDEYMNNTSDQSKGPGFTTHMHIGVVSI